MSLPKNIFFGLCMIGLTAILLPTARAQDDSKLGISLGVFVTDRDSTTRIDLSSLDRGTEVDLESDLGLDSSDSVFRLDGYYRFNERHRLDFSWFDLSRSATTVLERDIEWGETLFPVDATVESDFDLNIYKLAYTWSFLHREKGFLGLTAGLYVADIDLNLHGETVNLFESNAVTAPLPVVGLRGRYDFTDRFSFIASGELFALEYDSFDGELIDLYAGLDYALSDRFTVGIGLNSVKLDISVDDEDLMGDLDWEYDGALIRVMIKF